MKGNMLDETIPPTRNKRVEPLNMLKIIGQAERRRAGLQDLILQLICLALRNI